MALMEHPVIQLDAGDAVAELAGGPATGRRRRRAVVAGGVALVLALGGATAVWANWNTAQNRELDEARAQYTSVRADAVDVERAAAGALLAATGIVADDLAGDLDTLLDGATRADPDEMSRGTRADQAAAWRAAAEDLKAQTASILSTAEQVTTAHASVAQASVVQAINGLSAAREAAAAALAAAEGKVADESVRTALASSIERADALLGDDTLASVEAAVAYEVDLTKASTQITAQSLLNAQMEAGARLRTDATAELSAATTAVTDAQAAWQAEADRVAAEQAAQAAAAAATTTSPRAASSASRSGSSSTPSSGSAGGGATAPASGGSTTVETWEYSDETICMDTVGNAWSC